MTKYITITSPSAIGGMKMALIRDWKSEIDVLNVRECEEIRNALHRLGNWSFFRYQFKDMGFDELRDMIDRRLFELTNKIKYKT